MKAKVKTPNLILDEIAKNARRLSIAHVVLGLVSAFVYWISPGAFTPRLHTPRRIDGIVVILKTLGAWAPYVVSWLVSRVVLPTRDPKASLMFIALATCVAAGAAGSYLGMFKIPVPPVPFGLSLVVTVTLVSLVGLLSFVWKDDAPE